MTSHFSINGNLNIMNKLTRIAFAVTAGLSITLTTGCAGTKPNQALDSARATYERVSDETLQDAYSTEDLNVAKRKLDSANKAWKDKKDDKIINHRSYIAEQYALIAEQRSELLGYQAKIENGNMERTRVQVDLRSSEAKSLRDEVMEREAQLAKQLLELEELKALQAKNTDRGMVLTLGDVLFDTGESTLKAGARSNIERVASFLKKYPDRSLTIEGHTDNTGDDDYNYNLSVERAFAVRSALMAQGIDITRIQAKGLGEDVPIASNSNASGRQQNRRVELIFDQQQDSSFSETIITSEIDE